MKRMHVNLSVTDLDQSIAFYNALFASKPSVLKPDYAKWMLDDPRLNFSITTRGTLKGIDHLGIQVEDDAELGEVYERLASADAPTIEEGETTCCYANSEKSWIFDPDSIAWETFLTRGESTVTAATRSGRKTRPRPAAFARRPRMRNRSPVAVSGYRSFDADFNRFVTFTRYSVARLSKPPSPEKTYMGDRKYNLLFLCTGNSARSQIAECLLNRYGSGKFTGYSAGSHPSDEIHPLTHWVLQQNNYLTDRLRPKDWSEFAEPGAPQMDFVFTVCDKASAETCPVWPGQPMTAHWGTADPARVEGLDMVRRAAFRNAFAELEHRISIFVNLPFDSLDRLRLKQQLDEIGRSKPAEAEG